MKGTSSNDQVQTGDILECSWGYDQTNIDFYEIVDKRGKATVSIRQLRTNVEPATGGGWVTPVKGSYFGDPETHRVKISKWDGTPSVKLNDYSRAYPWKGGRSFSNGVNGWGR